MSRDAILKLRAVLNTSHQIIFTIRGHGGEPPRTIILQTISFNIYECKPTLYRKITSYSRPQFKEVITSFSTFSGNFKAARCLSLFSFHIITNFCNKMAMFEMMKTPKLYTTFQLKRLDSIVSHLVYPDLRRDKARLEEL